MHHKTLQALFESIKHGDTELDSKLQTFDGVEPDDTAGIWSWNEKCIMVGTCVDDLTIESRIWLGETEADRAWIQYG